MSKQMKGKFKSMFAKKSQTSFDKGSGKCLISKEVLKNIDSSQTILQRVRNLKELSEIVTVKIMEEHEVEALLNTISDLLDHSTPIDGRQAALQFLIAVTNGQYERLGILRTHIFRIIVEHDIEEDLQFRITLLKVLTDDGKDITYCEQIGPFLESLMEKALGTTNSVAFLGYLVKIVHYHSSFLDKSIVCSIVSKTCDFCNNENGEQDVESSLQLLDATVRYGSLPSEGLQPLIETLCRTVNIERFCQSSWKLMRNLIGTKLGHTAVFIMCQILEDNQNILDVILLRGAVFFIGMSIWGSKRVASLRYSPLHVLTSIKVCLQCNHHLVAHEVILSLQRLVKKFGEDQEIITWDILMDITENLLHMVERGIINSNSVQQLHELLSNMESLYLEEKFFGSTERFFKILASCTKDRPEESIATLLGYYQNNIDPSSVEWSEVFELISKHLTNEKRSSIKVRVVETTKNIYSSYRHRHEDEILSYIFHGEVSRLVSSDDHEIRKSMAHLLSFILQHCAADKYPELSDVLTEFLSFVSTCKDDKNYNMEDILIVVDALIDTFKTRLFEPSNIYVVGLLKILIKHLNDHFNLNISSFSAGKIRRKIFQLVLSLRSSEEHFIGLKEGGDEDDTIRYSAHAIFEPTEDVVFNTSRSVACFINFDFQQCFQALLKCLKNEFDFNVLELVLKEIVKQLENKNIFVFCQCNMNKLCSALCMVINDMTYLNKMKNFPAAMTMPELRNLIFPILSKLSTYHSYLVKDRQVELVTSIEFGLQTRSALTCVSCLTVCILEMQEIMRRTLPSILVKLSQITSSSTMSIAILKFLSTLKEIANLYCDFEEEQYMSIFAMALPYTDCHKYSVYIVTMAHQVIADWFTRCKLIFRKDFVSLIVAALRSNNSSNSKIGAENGDGGSRSGGKPENQELQNDMTDVCLDMMARYSFSLHHGQPKRSPLVDFLLSQGSSQTWLVGNVLVTVTTSDSENQGGCDCFNWKRKHQQQYANEMTDGAEESFRKKREKRPLAATSSFKGERTGDVDYQTNTTNATSKPIYLVKLTQKIVEQNDSFSPSEKLLFSRQASKVVSDGILEGNESESTSTDDDDDETKSGSDDSNNGNYGGDGMIDSFEDPIFQPEITVESNIVNTATSKETAAPPNTKPLKMTTRVGELNNSSSLKQNKTSEPCSVPIMQQHHRSNHGDEIGPMPPPKLDCRCVCSGWAEIVVQRPSGKISWVMKLENREVMKGNDFADLMLLKNCLDHDTTPSISESLKSTDSDVWKQSHAGSDSSSISSSVKNRRRFSTGSIDDAIMQQLEKSPVLSFKSIHSPTTTTPTSTTNFTTNTTPTKIPGKRALTKTFSQPTQGPASRKRSSSFNAVPKKHQNDNQQQHDPRKIENTWSPNFIFLQLFYSSFGNVFQNPPVLLEQTEAMQRTLKILNRIPVYNTHKFGVLYVAPGQEESEVEILENEFGSIRYTNFLSGLGEMICLSNVYSDNYFTGGLSPGEDGKFACIWKDNTTQVVFHVATLMPLKDCDKKCISKKRHIGNNYVTIIYDDSEGYSFGTIKGQFNYAEILIRPIEYSNNIVMARMKQGNKIVCLESQTISDANLAVLVRQLAIHTNMALVTDKDKTTNAFAPNWLQRLRQIKRIRSKVDSKNGSSSSSDNLDKGNDFTMYT